MRAFIDQTFQLICRLGAARTTVGIDGNGVGKHGLYVHIDQRRFIVTRHQGAVQPCGNAGCEGRQIRTHVGVSICTQSGKVVVLVQRHFDLGHVIAAMGIRHERLGPAGCPFDRTVTGLGGECAERLFLVVKDLCAKTAAHIGGYNAQFMFGDAQNECAHQQADDVRVLRGGI